MQDDRASPRDGRIVFGQRISGQVPADAWLNDKIEAEAFKARGMRFGISLLNKAIANHAVVIEIVFEFADRKREENKGISGSMNLC